MKKRSKKTASRRFVRLTRAHLEMSGRFTDVTDKRYAITALCVRRSGDAAVVEATNGRTAWRFPAEWVDASELPAFAGAELADGERVLIDPEVAKCCLRSLPKSHPNDLWRSAYLAVDGGVGVLHTAGGASFRLTHYGEDATWPNIDEMIPEQGGPTVALNAKMLGKIAAWASKLPAEYGEDLALVLSFHPHHNSSVSVRFDTTRDGGPVGVLAPVLTRSKVASKSMLAWSAAWEVTGKGCNDG